MASMTGPLRRIWAHLACHGWPLMVGGFLSGFAFRFSLYDNLWFILPALAGILLVIPLITATITDMITTVKHWREEPPSTKGSKQ